MSISNPGPDPWRAPPATDDSRPDTARGTYAPEQPGTTADIPSPATGHHLADPPRATHTPGRREVLAREKERYGGIKWGSAFFGWLTATGTALILTALVAATGTAIGLANTAGAGQALDQAGQAVQNPATTPTVGVVGAIVLLVLLFIAYYCGGYVAGRMARFDGAKQGFAVWVWAVAIAIVVAVLGLAAGAQFDVLAQLNGLPRLPINEGDLTTGGIIAALLALAASLLGAILGGLAGMHFHRKVDRAGLGH
jgi:hypothetical protein